MLADLIFYFFDTEKNYGKKVVKKAVTLHKPTTAIWTLFCTYRSSAWRSQHSFASRTTLQR
jgi:hypothetical protein